MDCALLDTSVLVDRAKAGYRRSRIDEILSGYEFTVTTGIALLEYKAVVIQELILIYNTLRAKERFTLARDALIESLHKQHRLRAHFFNNVINIYGSSLTITEKEDKELAKKASLQLKQIIPLAYKEVRESVGSFQVSEINCSRAQEPPAIKVVAFETNLPICVRGKNKLCDVENFVRQHLVPLTESLRASMGTPSPESPDDFVQLRRACDLIDEIGNDPARDNLSHSECRRMGDCLVAAEGRMATHNLSTNGRDWQPISDALSKEFVLVTYPEEKK